MTDTRFSVSDIEVDTLGLVTAGASGEEFFMYKSAEGEPVTATQEEGEIVVAKNILRRIVDMLKATMIEPEPEPEPEPETTIEIGKTEEVPVEAVPQEAVPQEEEASLDKSEAISDGDGEPVTDGGNQMSEEFEKVETRVEELAKANTDLLERLEKAEKEVQRQQELRERETVLAKARGYSNLPAKVDELADQIFWLTKADSERAEYWTSLLSAVDSMLSESGLFVEKGTSAADDPVTVAIGKTSDVKDALLSLDARSQSEYIKKMRQMSREVM